MLGILTAMLVTLESGSVAPPPRLDLAVERLQFRDLVVPVGETPSEGSVRLARTLSDCDPAMVGIEPGADRPAASQDLLVCRAALLKGEPVGKAILWVHSTGIQLAFSTTRLQLSVRFDGL